MKIGVLDDPIDIPTTIRCAQTAEALGFSRYWLTEHHDVNDAWASPEIVLALIAMYTRTLTIGSAGTLLRFHNPLQVACDFALLASLFPGRIELGLARGVPNVRANADVLAGCGFAADYAGRVAFVLQLFDPSNAADGVHMPIVVPHSISRPAIWILGSSRQSFEIACRHDLAYSHALFLKSSEPFGPAELEGSGALGKRNIAVAGICAASSAAIDAIAREAPTGMVPTVVGTPDHCVDQLEGLAVAHDVEEIMFMDLARDPQHRGETLRLLADELGHRPTRAAPTR